MNNATISVIAEPSILSANTYFWSANSSASGRRCKEKKVLSEVVGYLRGIGFTVKARTDEYAAIHASTEFAGQVVSVVFSYSESCANVYKSLCVSRDGRPSNITLVRKIAAVCA